MSLTIRKLLSRKFNNVCLNLAGLLTYLKLFRLPIHQSDSDYEVNNILFFIEVPNQVWHKLTVAGTVPDSHWIPF